MTKAEAFKALRLDESADVQMVESAYWTLVRQAQGRVGRDPEAEHEIDRLNDAYAKLSPNGRGKPQPQRTRASVDAGTGVTALDNFADWCAEQALKTRVFHVGTWRDVNLGLTPQQIIDDAAPIELGPADYDDGMIGRYPPSREEP